MIETLAVRKRAVPVHNLCAAFILAIIAAPTAMAAACPIDNVGMPGIRIDVISYAYAYGGRSYDGQSDIVKAVQELSRPCPMLLVAAHPSNVARATQLCTNLKDMGFENLVVTVAGEKQRWTLYPPGAYCTPIKTSQ
jgi:hypothetical protein